MTVTDHPGPRPHRLRLLLEMLGLFFVLPLLAWLARGLGWHLPIIPSALLLGAAAWFWLRAQPDFDRRRMWRWPRERALWRRILLRFAGNAVVMVALTMAVLPDELFGFPRHRPEVWALVMFGYPLLSVLPQELAYRAFFLHRYRTLLPSNRVRILVSALAFGHVHVIFGHWQSVLLSAIGGVLFCDSYLRARSIWAAWAEHALYGCFAFTVGMGTFFYGGHALAP